MRRPVMPGHLYTEAFGPGLDVDVLAHGARSASGVSALGIEQMTGYAVGHRILQELRQCP